MDVDWWPANCYPRTAAMLKTIAAASPELTQFVEALKLPLNKPQHQHVTQLAIRFEVRFPF